MQDRRGMSLVEIILALTIAGGVFAASAGVVTTDIVNKNMNDKGITFNNEIALTLADMQSKGEMPKSEDEFFGALEKYMPNVEKISEADISSSFSSEYKDKSGNKINLDDYPIKIKTANGISMAVTFNSDYNPRHTFSQNSTDKTDSGDGLYNHVIKNEALSRIKGFYDINGAKGPNKIGKDVRFFAEFPKDCADTNFIPDQYGKCPSDYGNSIFPHQKFCANTNAICHRNGSLKSLDKNSCQCTCQISCPNGKLDKDSCSCGCTEDERKAMRAKYSGNSYIDPGRTELLCYPVLKDIDAPEKCKKNGGVWDYENYTCNCQNLDDYTDSFAEPDPTHYCELKCKDLTDDQFRDLVRKHVGTKYTNNEVMDIILDHTKKDNNPKIGCFTCDATAEKHNELVGLSKVGTHDGYCAISCPNQPTQAEKDKYAPYHTFNDISAEENACRWTCNKDALDKKVAELNRRFPGGFYPVVLDGKTHTNTVRHEQRKVDFPNNFEEAQRVYYAAADIIIGAKKPDPYFGVCQYDKFLNSKVPPKVFVSRKTNCNGSNGCMCLYYNGSDYGKTDIYNKFVNEAKGDNSKYLKFAGFLRYAAGIRTDNVGSYNDKTIREKLQEALDNAGITPDTYKIKYVADYNSCTVKLNSLDYGEPPVNTVELAHTQSPWLDDLFRMSRAAGYRAYHKYTFNLTPIKLGDLSPDNDIRVALYNDNNQIKSPTEKVKNYLDDIVVGVRITISERHEPLALNIGSDPYAYPTSKDQNEESFKFKYSANNTYENAEVIWQDEDTCKKSDDENSASNKCVADNTKQPFVYIVNSKFSSTGGQHVGNMMSDVYTTTDNKQYGSGFEQLKAQYDTDGDGLISRNEFDGSKNIINNSISNKLYAWKKTDNWTETGNHYRPLTDFVFDINTYFEKETEPDGSPKQNDDMYYDIVGQYRRLIPIKGQPECTGGKICLKFDSYKVKGDNVKYKEEKWVPIGNNNNSNYYWLPTGTSNSDLYSWNTWKTDDSSCNFNDENRPELYYKDSKNKWYKVEIYSVVDIIFKSYR